MRNNDDPRNYVYRTPELAKHYSHQRASWSDFYPSERAVIERLELGAGSRVIDMGCACGGLGVALRERFEVVDYWGVDINSECIERAPTVCPHGQFVAGDFLDITERLPRDFDLAASLGCADWNVQTEDLLRALFAHVKVGGHLLYSCRLSQDQPRSPGVTCAAQDIVFDEDVGASACPEEAPYKVYRLEQVLGLLLGLGPVREIIAHGYFGDVPKTVKGLPWKRVFYLVCAVERASEDGPPRLRLNVDPGLLVGEHAGHGIPEGPP